VLSVVSLYNCFSSSEQKYFFLNYHSMQKKHCECKRDQWPKSNTFSFPIMSRMKIRINEIKVNSFEPSYMKSIVQLFLRKTSNSHKNLEKVKDTKNDDLYQWLHINSFNRYPDIVLNQTVPEIVSMSAKIKLITWELLLNTLLLHLCLITFCNNYTTVNTLNYMTANAPNYIFYEC